MKNLQRQCHSQFFHIGLTGTGQAGPENPRVTSVLAVFPDRLDWSRSGRSKKSLVTSVLAVFPDRSGRSGKSLVTSVLAVFPDRPDQSRSGRSGAID
ncbi:hypothetical protein TIFTF001_052485 [Ficus carica]|uniref:Uncharacterized protein n=1 Tax=Ficus carica TaxID=3494 RepID=A0AA88JHI0_FICCA|nr:hypothetical protein TIFTF001_052485 [Ficus carica]